MIVRYSKIGESKQQVHAVDDDIVRVGSNKQNNIVLNSPIVSSLAAVISRSSQGWELISKSPNAILVGGHPIHDGERTIVLNNTPIEIYPYELFLDSVHEALHEGPDHEAIDHQLSEFLIVIHKKVIAQLDIDSEAFDPNDVDFLKSQENNIEEFARIAGLLSVDYDKVLRHTAGMTVLNHLLVEVLDTIESGIQWKSNGSWNELQTSIERFESEMNKLVKKIRQELRLEQVKDKTKRVEKVELEYWPIWEKVGTGLYQELVEYLALRFIKKQIKDIMFGYGPLEDLLRMPSISEIMVVSRDQIYVEKRGVLEKTGRSFVSDEVTISIIDRIVQKVGRRIDKSEPLVDARLLDGSRVNAVIPPIAINGPCITIRKFPDKRLQVEDLIRYGSFTAAADRFLEASVKAGCNILVSGGTGSGKTTLLNCLSDYIPDKDRIVTIEDTAELQLAKEHVVRMETKSANVEGRGEYDIRSLVKNSLRMRPDRIVVGECRGAEALDMLQAMNTGHDGSMTTVHANTAEDVILRLEVLVQQAADLPLQSIHRQIASAINLVVQLSRLENGRRCVTQITEFVDYDESESRIVTKDLFKLGAGGYDAILQPTGCLPSFMPKLVEHDLLDLELFYC